MNIKPYIDRYFNGPPMHEERARLVLEELFEEVITAERKRCAKIARSWIKKGAYANTCLDIARAIENRGGE